MVVGYNRRLKQHLQKTMEYTARRYGLTASQFRRCVELDISPRVAASVIRYKAGERDV